MPVVADFVQGGVATFGDAGHEAESVRDEVSAAQTQEGSAGGENSQGPLGQCKCFRCKLLY